MLETETILVYFHLFLFDTHPLVCSDHHNKLQNPGIVVLFLLEGSNIKAPSAGIAPACIVHWSKYFLKSKYQKKKILREKSEKKRKKVFLCFKII